MFSGDKDSGSNLTSQTDRDDADKGWVSTLEQDGLKEGWNKETGQWGIQTPDKTDES